VAVDMERFRHHMGRAAEAGLVDAQYWLGAMLYQSSPPPRDAKEFVYWLVEAAKHGVAQAQFLAGLMRGLNRTARMAWPVVKAPIAPRIVPQACRRNASDKTAREPVLVAPLELYVRPSRSEAPLDLLARSHPRFIAPRRVPLVIAVCV